MKKTANNAMKIMADYFGLIETRVPLHNAAAEARSMESMKAAQIRMIESHKDTMNESDLKRARQTIAMLEASLPREWRYKHLTIKA